LTDVGALVRTCLTNLCFREGLHMSAALLG
jgi:hypothetical protein